MVTAAALAGAFLSGEASAQGGVVGTPFDASRAAAKQPVSTAPLAPLEVLLEVAGEGKASAPADRARLYLVLTGRGTTAPEARAELAKQRARVIDVLRPLGLGPQDVVAPTSPSTARIGFIGNEAMAGAMAGITDPRFEIRQEPVQVNVRNVAAAKRIRDALEAAGFEPAQPSYEVGDDRQLVRSARSAALADARERADVYAAAAGMRVLRIVRISERSGGSATETEAYRMMLQAFVNGSADRDIVERSVNLSVDFAIARP